MMCVYGTVTEVYMSAVTVFLFFPLGLMISIANAVLRYSKFNVWIKVLLHFLIFTAGMILCIYLPHGKMLSPGVTLVVLAIYFLIYVITAIIYWLVYSKLKQNKQKSSEYKKVY